MEPRPLRSDARLNRDRLVAAARERFEEEGSAASLEGIARSAGVGIGTLYRHFPTREALVEAVFDDQVGEWIDAADAAAAIDDPWEGLRAYLYSTIELQAAHRALRHVVAEHLAGENRIDGVRAEIRSRLGAILERGRAEGALRSDFTLSDLALLLWSFGPLSDAPPHAARRHLGFVLDGLRASAATPQAEPPLTDEELTVVRRALRPGPKRRVA